MRLAGLILAAGESRRMGFPKALLEYREEVFLDRLIGLFAPHCSPVVAVLGADAVRVRSGLRRAGQAVIVVNDDYLSGQISSMQCGLRAMPAGTEAVLFTLVDHPAVEEATLRCLLREGLGPVPLRIPRYQGKRGHPVLCSAGLMREFLELAPGLTARDVVNRHAARIEYIDVDDPGVVTDVDDPEAYRRLRAGGPA